MSTIVENVTTVHDEIIQPKYDDQKSIENNELEAITERNQREQMVDSQISSRDTLESTRLDEDNRTDTRELSMSIVPSEMEAAGKVPRELLIFRDEIQHVRSVLTCIESSTAKEDIVQQIRTWGSRLRVEAASTTRMDIEGSELLNIVMKRVKSLEATITNADTVLHGVVCFEDGVYRGQVAPVVTDSSVKSQRYLPHGSGIVTTSDGLRRVGQWCDGTQVGIGSLQSTVLLYDGQWAENSPTGYGIGYYAFGVTFCGSWLNGRPYGLGCMQSLSDDNRGKVLRQSGWFHGMNCLQHVAIKGEDAQNADHNTALERLLPLAEYDQQPQRGLYLLGIIMEGNRIAANRRMFDHWRTVVCDQVVSIARQCRTQATSVWIRAHEAQERAVDIDIAMRVEERKLEMAAIVKEIQEGREKHARMQRIREFHLGKHERAVYQTSLVKKSVESQQETIALMEQDLAEVTMLIADAKQAEDECKNSSKELGRLKREIDSTCVQINKLRDHLRKIGNKQADIPPLESRQTTPQLVENAPTKHEETSKLDLLYVCDIPGCNCGIPRDVFVRVAGVLNGE